VPDRPTPGTRVRFNERCVWPERIGCEGIVVDHRAWAPTYPQPLPHEVIILLDHDPLLADRWSAAHQDVWTCCTGVESLDVLPREANPAGQVMVHALVTRLREAQTDG
jgi:hypothetical protein